MTTERKQRAELKKSLRATVRGNRYSTDRRNRNEMIALMTDWLRLDQETAEHTYGVFLKATARDGLLSRNGIVKFAGEVPLDRVFDFSVVEEINRELPK